MSAVVIPGEIDPAAASFLVVAIGADERTAEVARSWVSAATAIAPTRMVVLDSMVHPEDRTALAEALGQLRTGARILVTGGRYDVLQALALAREAGAIAAELSAEITHTRDLPVYCAHCRDTFHRLGAPGGEVVCPGCRRVLEVDDHSSAVLGSYLASTTGAEEPAA